jgi:curli biogenesis system outer membrane secretion channel CsgG
MNRPWIHFASRIAAAAVLLLPVLALSGCTTSLIRTTRPLPKEAIPPVIAVASFDNRSGFQGQWELGSGMADLLVSEIVASRNFVVVERKHLNTVIDEIARQKDKLFRPEGKVNDGRLKNARYLVRGVINDFSQISGGSFGFALRQFFFLGRGHTARVALTLTIVDVETGEIVDSVQCAGIARARSAYIKANYKGVDFGGDAFFKTPLGIATSNALRRGLHGIVKKVPRTWWRPMIAEVTAGRIVINGGENRGVKGDTLYRVREKGRAVTDPATGDTLDIIPGRVVGTIRITEVKDHIAFAEAVQGTQFARGQHLSRVR